LEISGLTEKDVREEIGKTSKKKKYKQRRSWFTNEGGKSVARNIKVKKTSSVAGKIPEGA